MEPTLSLHYALWAFRHLNEAVVQWSNAAGPGLYLILFAIVFLETGLVVFPFLPGDSLLFAVGAVCALDQSAITIQWVIPLLTAAAVIGDALNYHIGARVGERAFTMESRFIKRKHLLKTQAFYERYGGKTIVFARFVPIVRTFAPFVAGIGQMQYRRFFQWNVIGGAAWVTICVVAGYLLGRVEFIKKHFEGVIVAIIIISVLPMVIEIAREWMKARRNAANAAADPASSAASADGKSPRGADGVKAKREPAS